MIDPSFFPILLGFFAIVTVSGYLIFDLMGAIIGACLYLIGTIYAAICSKKKIGFFKESDK